MPGSTSGIMITMIPIFALFIILGIAMAYKHSKNAKNTSSSEANALIEAQAMLAKMKKEQAEKDEAKPEKEGKDTDEGTKKPMSEYEKSKEQPEDEPEHPKKPVAEAPIEDTTELEPDIEIDNASDSNNIDKSENE